MCHTTISRLLAQFISRLQLTLHHESGLRRVQGKGAWKREGRRERGRDGGEGGLFRKTGNELPYFRDQTPPLITGHHRIIPAPPEGLNKINAALV